MTHSTGERASALTFQLVKGASEFHRVADAWSALYHRAGCPTPALTSAAVNAYLEHRILSGEESAIMLASTDTEIVGALPLVAALGPGGYRLRTFSDLHTYGVDFLVDPSWKDKVYGAMLEHLLQQFTPVYSIQLADVRAASPTIATLHSMRQFAMHVETNRRASYSHVPADINEFLGRLSHNFRKNLRKQESRLRALPEVRLEVVAAADAMPQHFDLFTALEASGWKGSNGTAIASNATLLAYYRDLATELARTGHLEWHFLWVGDSLIAANLGVRTERVLALVKIAYAEAYAGCGPGNMLFLQLLRRESAQGVSEEIDCLTDMPWHRNWQMASRDYLSVKLFPRRPQSLLCGYMPLVARDVLRRIPALRTLARRLRRT